ncbi:hypothetical protein ABW19_dt0203856 [Dactylella cylindrospora]|nr:hypothetical protein ABW19_dt0203856 [Dactylella cylindrospora]
MPFVPELVSTTRYSNRNTPMSSTLKVPVAPTSTTSSTAAGTDDAILASKPRFLPEPIETSRRSNRVTPLSDASISTSSSQPSSSSSTPKATLDTANSFVLSPAAPSSSGEAQQEKQKPRFLPEPVETIKRSNRTEAGKTNKSSNNNNYRKGWGRDSDDEDEKSDSAEELASYHLLLKEKQKRVPVPFVAASEKSKWFPETDDSTRWPRQQNYPRYEQGRPRVALNSNTSGNMNANARPEGGRILGAQSHSIHSHGYNQGRDSGGGETVVGPTKLDTSEGFDRVDKVASSCLRLPQQAISSHNRNYRNNGDPSQFGGSGSSNYDEGIFLASCASSNPAHSPGNSRSGDEGACSDSLSSSPAGSLKSNASGPNYLLSDDSRISLNSNNSSSQSDHQCPSRDFTVIPSITNSHYFTEEPQATAACLSGEQDIKKRTTQQAAGTKRPISPGTILARDFALDSHPQPLNFPIAGGTSNPAPCLSASVPTQPLGGAQIPQHRDFGTNILSSPAVTPLHSNIQNYSKNKQNNFQKSPTAADLRDQVLAAQSQILRDNKALLAPTLAPTVSRYQYQPSSQPSSHPAGGQSKSPLPQNGSDEPKRKKPLLPFSFIPAAPRPMNSPLLAVPSSSSAHSGLLSPGFPKSPLIYESPMPTTLYYESSKSSNGDYFSSKKKPSGMSISSNSSALSRDTAITTPSTRPSSPGVPGLKYGYPTTSTSSLVQMVCETPPAEHMMVPDPPNMCPTKKCEVSTEFVVAVFNYLSLGHESIARKFDKELAEATGWGLERVVTDRLGALREYVEEYVDRKPAFGSGMGGW